MPASATSPAVTITSRAATRRARRVRTSGAAMRVDEDDLGLAEAQDVAVAQRAALHPLAVDVGAGGAVLVDDLDGAVGPGQEQRVAARDGAVLEADVGGVATADA